MSTNNMNSQKTMRKLIHAKKWRTPTNFNSQVNSNRKSSMDFDDVRLRKVKNQKNKLSMKRSVSENDLPNFQNNNDNNNHHQSKYNHLKNNKSKLAKLLIFGVGSRVMGTRQKNKNVGNENLIPYMKLNKENTTTANYKNNSNSNDQIASCKKVFINESQCRDHHQQANVNLNSNVMDGKELKIEVCSSIDESLQKNSQHSQKVRVNSVVEKTNGENKLNFKISDDHKKEVNLNLKNMNKIDKSIPSKTDTNQQQSEQVCSDQNNDKKLKTMKNNNNFSSKYQKKVSKSVNQIQTSAAINSYTLESLEEKEESTSQTSSQERTQNNNNNNNKFQKSIQKFTKKSKSKTSFFETMSSKNEKSKIKIRTKTTKTEEKTEKVVQNSSRFGNDHHDAFSLHNQQETKSLHISANQSNNVSNNHINNKLNNKIVKSKYKQSTSTTSSSKNMNNNSHSTKFESMNSNLVDDLKNRLNINNIELKFTKNFKNNMNPNPPPVTPLLPRKKLQLKRSFSHNDLSRNSSFNLSFNCLSNSRKNTANIIEKELKNSKKKYNNNNNNNNQGSTNEIHHHHTHLHESSHHTQIIYNNIITAQTASVQLVTEPQQTIIKNTTTTTSDERENKQGKKANLSKKLSHSFHSFQNLESEIERRRKNQERESDEDSLDLAGNFSEGGIRSNSNLDWKQHFCYKPRESKKAQSRLF